MSHWSALANSQPSGMEPEEAEQGQRDYLGPGRSGGGRGVGTEGAQHPNLSSSLDDVHGDGIAEAQHADGHYQEPDGLHHQQDGAGLGLVTRPPRPADELRAARRSRRRPGSAPG